MVLSGANIKLQIDPADKILLKRNLNKNGKGQRFFTNEVKRLSDPYIPMRTGTLKRNVTLTPGTITYNVPYARKQYYENKGRGKQGTTKRSTHNYKCLRGARWTERMWSDRGKEIIQSVARYCGGKAK